MKKVYFYATCLDTAATQETILNAIKSLCREGAEVIFRKNQTCCSQPSFNSGYFKESKRIALYNVDLFEKDHLTVAPSGSCVGMMSYDYLELLKEDSEFGRVKEFPSRVAELSQYLDEALKVEYEDKGDSIRVTWHSNCHALRIQKSIETNKNLIKELKNVELVNLEYEEECCGFGGTFAVKEPEIPNAMARARIKDTQNTSTKCLIGDDGGCLLNIDGTIRKVGLDIRGLYLYDFLLKRLEGVRLQRHTKK